MYTETDCRIPNWIIDNLIPSQDRETELQANLAYGPFTLLTNHHQYFYDTDCDGSTI